MCFENLFNIYKKILYKEIGKCYRQYSWGEVDYIATKYDEYDKSIRSLINHLLVESVRCKNGGGYDIYNSEQLFISLYNKFKNIN